MVGSGVAAGAGSAALSSNVTLLAKGTIKIMFWAKVKTAACVLVPNGVVCFDGKVDAAKLKSAGFKDVKSSGGWTVAVKGSTAGTTESCGSTATREMEKKEGDK